MLGIRQVYRINWVSPDYKSWRADCIIIHSNSFIINIVDLVTWAKCHTINPCRSPKYTLI